MLELINVLDYFRISTTGMTVSYSDEGYADIKCCAHLNDDNNVTLVKVSFYNVAEIKCHSVNFYESFYKQYCLIHEKSSKNEFTGFYNINKSQYLRDNNEKYDPKNRLNLKHYLVAGNNGYCEIIANNFKIMYGRTLE